MKKAALCAGAVLLCVGLLFVSAHSQDDMEYVDNSIFDSPRRTAAPFAHVEHNENAGIEDCTECHHVYDEQGNKLEYESSEDQYCSDCHEFEDVGPQPGLMKAFHLNCKGCHLGRQKGPIVCGECHTR